VIDTADVVLHGLTGERWVVACVDGDRLRWCGWPEGSAELKDCTLVEKATPEARLKLLMEIAEMREPDHRGRHARATLAALTPIQGEKEGEL
jgi:hypothetical protein